MLVLFATENAGVVSDPDPARIILAADPLSTVPLNVKFASPFNVFVVPVAVTTKLSVLLLIVTVADTPDDPELPLVPELPELPLAPDVPELPLVPDVPELPLVPDVPELPPVPEEPDVPDVPELPLVPDVPEEPDVPEVPLLPDEPFAPEVPEVPAVPAGVKANEAVPKNPTPLATELVNEVADTVPATDTCDPLSVIMESVRCSNPALLTNRFCVKSVSFPTLLNVGGPIITTDEVVPPTVF